MKNLLNVVLYQLTWIASVAGAAHGYWWSGAVMLAVFALWQLSVSAFRGADLQLMLLAALLGFGVDSMLAGNGWITYATAAPWPHLAPVWIVVLWANFALTFNHALAFLKTNRPLAALFGAMGGPAAYWVAASSFHAITFPGNSGATLALLAAIWGVVTPLLCTVAARLPAAQPRAVQLANAGVL